jgi:hypothetical protein
MNYLLFGDGENFSKFGIRRPETKALEKNSLDDLQNQIRTKVNISLRIISIVYESNFVLFRLFSYNTFCNRSTPFHIVLFRFFLFFFKTIKKQTKLFSKNVGSLFSAKNFSLSVKRVSSTNLHNCIEI